MTHTLRLSWRYFCLILYLAVSVNVMAQTSRADGLYADGVQLRQTFTVSSQEAAIQKFQQAKIAYTSAEKKAACDTQMEKCRSNIKRIQDRNSNASKKGGTVSIKPNPSVSAEIVNIGTNVCAKVDDIEIWPNQNIKNEPGMLIQMRLEIQGMKDKKCRVMVFFSDEYGRSLKDTNNKYASAGLVVTDEVVTPNFPGALWKEFKLGIPYSELHLTGSGDKSVQICIGVFDVNGSQAKQLLLTPYLMTSFYYDDTHLEVNGNGMDQEVAFSATGGKTTFNVTANTEWTLQEVPSWCSIEQKTDKSFVLVCPPNRATRPHNDYFVVRAGRRKVRIYIKQSAATSASAVIHDLWVNTNVFQDIILGSYIHVDLEVFGLFNQDVSYTVLFYKADGKTPLVDEDGQQVQYTSTMEVEYDICRWSDWVFFVPNAWLKNATNSDGRYAFDVVIRDANGKELARNRNNPLSFE